jgi:predicted nucleic acid-binding protein
MPADADRPIALDTSVAVPLLVRTHSAHRMVAAWWRGRPVALSGHAHLETYAVLTRLPGDVRVAPDDAARLLAARFESPLLLTPADAGRIADTLADLGIAGGAVYDAVVALAAVRHRCVLATRDARAKATYDAVGAEVEIVA